MSKADIEERMFKSLYAYGWIDYMIANKCDKFTDSCLYECYFNLFIKKTKTM
jgi:hypothetical protein